MRMLRHLPPNTMSFESLFLYHNQIVGFSDSIHRFIMFPLESNKKSSRFRISAEFQLLRPIMAYLNDPNLKFRI